MKILKGNFGECRFCDNMDKDYGLPSLHDKSWDLCLTDPPYSVNAKSDTQKKKAEENSGKHYETSKKIEYEDNMDWITKVQTMEKCFEVATFTLFTCGLKEFPKWINYKIPKEILYWFKPNCFGKTSHFCNVNLEPILCYGYIDDLFPFRSNVVRVRLENGFLRKETESYLHSTPKEPPFYRSLIKNYTKPLTSIIDPFLGSGTTAEVCEELGIPWLGYEIMEEYAPDIEKRIQRGIGKHKTNRKQMTLEV